MGAHQKAFTRLEERLKTAADSAHVDMLLDTWIRISTRATEWDADQWGFDPDRWMEIERAEMNKLGEPARK